MRKPNRDEVIAGQFLAGLGKKVEFEPNGNVPPDFLVDGRIAVEVRRLNQHFRGKEKNEGLESTRMALQQGFQEVMNEFPREGAEPSHFVSLRFRRPVPTWKVVGRALRKALMDLRIRPLIGEQIEITDHVWIRLHRASESHATAFLLGGMTDRDSGGCVIPELARNIELCLQDKWRKIAPHRKRHEAWWLILVDHVSYVSIDSRELETLTRELPNLAQWDRVILVDPLNPDRSFDL